ncbi:hypothetical protein [Candidatus Amarobacter glycogenicus]|uniref:hypothetical protein n=1 Tax=Candidatus Amarobacter glycogenicus TaxID=3140699 RepID=UPI002A15C055|nr:hypothetical protein [Dehalococcoidia bacterium]
MKIVDALVLDDYEAVFPLPFKNRVVFKQIYQPFLYNNWVCFYKTGPGKINYIILSMRYHLHFRKINLHLNTKNPALGVLKVKHKVTHHIDLNKTYTELSAAILHKYRNEI